MSVPTRYPGDIIRAADFNELRDAVYGPTDSQVDEGIDRAEAVGRLGAEAHAAPLFARLATGVEDACLLVVGDSTGSASYWVTRLTDWLAAQYPTHTVLYYVWTVSGDGGSYAAPVTRQTGTGSRTLRIYQASAPGKSFDYAHQNLPLTNATVGEPDLIMVNYGHNQGSLSVQYDQFRDEQIKLMAVLRQRHPLASVITMSQNPWVVPGPPAPPAGLSGFRARQTEAAAAAVGCGFIDIHRTYIETGNPLDYIDGSGGHPTISGPYDGTQLWTNEIIRHFKQAQRSTSPLYLPPSPLTTLGADLLRGKGDFSTYTGTSVPTGWPSFGGATLSSDTTNFESGTSALKFTGINSGPAILYSDTVLPARLVKGEWVTLAARCFIPSSSVGGNPGIIALDDGTFTASHAQGIVRDQWFWATVSKRFSSSASYCRASIYADASAGTRVITIDRIMAFRGIVPRDIR